MCNTVHSCNVRERANLFFLFEQKHFNCLERLREPCICTYNTQHTTHILTTIYNICIFFFFFISVWLFYGLLIFFFFLLLAWFCCCERFMRAFILICLNSSVLRVVEIDSMVVWWNIITHDFRWVDDIVNCEIVLGINIVIGGQLLHIFENHNKK